MCWRAIPIRRKSSKASTSSKQAPCQDNGVGLFIFLASILAHPLHSLSLGMERAYQFSGMSVARCAALAWIVNAGELARPLHTVTVGMDRECEIVGIDLAYIFIGMDCECRKVGTILAYGRAGTHLA